VAALPDDVEADVGERSGEVLAGVDRDDPVVALVHAEHVMVIVASSPGVKVRRVPFASNDASWERRTSSRVTYDIRSATTQSTVSRMGSRSYTNSESSPLRDSAVGLA
jgi:hypothetical protein